MAWYLEKDAGKKFLVIDDRHEEIDSLDAGKIGKLEVTLNSGVKLEVTLTDFQVDACSFSEEFMGLLSSRTTFLSKWKKLCECEAKQNETQLKQTEKMTPSGVVDEVLKDKFLGTYDVHVTNMIGPQEGRGTREVDYGHVSRLETSFKEDSLGQVVLLIGMMGKKGVPRDLDTIGECKLETIGGNHTRLALQSLFQKGLLEKQTVKVNVYKPLTKMEALALGYQHNSVLEEKKKQMTFVEKVQMMRDCRPSEVMSAGEVTKWKNDLCVIFRAENRRKLQMNMAHHLQMARLPENLFVKVRQADGKKQVTDRLFKSMLRINSEEAYEQCMDILLASGASAFNAKVTEYVNQGMVRSKKKDSSGTSIGIETSSCRIDVASDVDDAVQSLEKTVKTLQAEKEELQKELQQLRAANKRKQDESLYVDSAENVKWKVGDVVDAKWKDNIFYPAKIQKVETVFHVIYTEDKKKGKLMSDDLKDRD